MNDAPPAVCCLPSAVCFHCLLFSVMRPELAKAILWPRALSGSLGQLACMPGIVRLLNSLCTCNSITDPTARAGRDIQPAVLCFQAVPIVHSRVSHRTLGPIAV